MKKVSPGRMATYLFLIIYALVVVLPMAWLLFTSLKDSWSIFKSPWGLPDQLHWINYRNAMVKGELAGKIGNSVLVDTIALVLILIFSAMAAYVLARFKFKLNKGLYYLFLVGMAIPVFLTVVPLFMMLRHFGIPGTHLQVNLNGTYLGLILVYTAYSLSFTIFVLHAFFKTLPWELAEAATIDGCKPSQIFWKIMLPLAKPGLATAGIFVFIGLWNEYPIAFVLSSGANAHKTLPVGIADLTMAQKYASDWGALFAGLTVGVLPTILLYAIFQEQIQEGLTAGAVKG